MPKWLKIVLGIVAGVAVLVAIVIYIVFQATAGAVETVERHLAALKAGNMEAAYGETSQAFRAATPLEGFVAFVDANPILKDIAETSFTSREVKNGVATISGKLTSSTGGVQPASY